MTYRRLLMILADGARADVMRGLIRDGRLPHIAEHLPNFRTGVTAFPSTTGPAYMPYLTGCYPGTCNVPGIRWFDKQAYGRYLSQHRFRSYVGAEIFYIGRDMDPIHQTLFQLIPRSFNLFNSVSRGVPEGRNSTWFTRIWYWYYAHLTDRWGLVDRAAHRKMLLLLKRDPEFLFVVFPGIDEHSHLASPFHPRTLESYEDLDRAIGDLFKDLQESRWSDTAVFIVSDHGLSETKVHLGLDQLLEEMGFSVLYYPRVVFRARLNAASMISGNGMAHLYFRKSSGWSGRIPWEELATRRDQLIQRLLEREAVDLIAGQLSDGSVAVKSHRGEAFIAKHPSPTTHHPSIKYTALQADPFGYPPLPSTMTERESLALTLNTDYPDALMQLLQIFRSRRTGDLVLSAKRGFDLRERYEVPEHKSTHGSLHREQMEIPIVSNVPLPEGPIRSVDLFPTILQLLGRPIPPGIDGQGLCP